MKKITPIILLAFSSLAFSEDKFVTNFPDVFIKNFSCSSGRATFNVVNKSNFYILDVYVNVFDKDGDPINKVRISGGVAANSGKEDFHFLDCNKLSRIGFSVN